jgi:hypothetical protein
VLIDAKQKKWLGAFLVLSLLALGAWWWVNRTTPGGLRGGDLAGLWFGILGSLLMIYAGLLAAVRKRPRWAWLGARQTWLRGHIWLGLLSVVLVLCHSSFRWGGPLEMILWVVLLVVVTSGVVGLILQNLLPRLVTARVPCEAPYEQIPHLYQAMRRKADAIIDEVCGPHAPGPHSLENTVAVVQYASDARAQLRDFYEQEVRPFLGPRVPRNSPLFNPQQAEAHFDKMKKLAALSEVAESVADIAMLCVERRLLREQERLHTWLHGWLLIHVPLSVALLVLGVLHVVAALYY